MTGTSEARTIAELAIEFGVGPDHWPQVVTHLETIAECEAFRVALLLQGKDTRSARLAITHRRDVILGLISQKRKYRKRKGQKHGR